MYERSTPYQMDSTWSGMQSSNQMDITTPLHHITGRCDRQTSSYSKMGFNPNEMPNNSNTLERPARYQMQIHEKTQSFQQGFQNGVALHHYPNSFKTGLQFHETETYRILPASHKSFTPGVTSLDPKEVIRPDSTNASQSHGIPSYQRGNPRDLYPNPTVNTDGMHRYQMNAKELMVSMQIGTSNSQFYQAGNESEMSSFDTTSRSLKRIPMHQIYFQEKVLTCQADAGTCEGMKASGPQTSPNRRMSPSPQPISSEQKSRNLSHTTQICPRCHCVTATQPQPSFPSGFSSKSFRTSVIMIPMNRKVEKTQVTPLPSPRDQDSDSSSEEKDREGEKDKYFRVNIDGTTARFKLTEEDWSRMPVKSFPSGGRLLSGDWIRIFVSKVKESNPWCSLRIKNNHVRSENSRKIHSAAFFRGRAECKLPKCNVKIRFTIHQQYGKHVDVAYVGNVCHRSQSDLGETLNANYEKLRSEHAHV